MCVRYPTPDLPQLGLVSLPLAPRTLVSVFPEPTGPECGIQYSFKALITRVSLEVDGSELRTGLLRDGPHFHPTLREDTDGREAQSLCTFARCGAVSSSIHLCR